MAGINRALFENRHLAKAASSSGNPCIFLSHISVDKPAVQAIATYNETVGTSKEVCSFFPAHTNCGSRCGS